MGSATLLLLMITNGFAILRSAIPSYLIWIYWINPLAWALHGLVVNELGAPRWGETGQQVMDEYAVLSEQHWVWAAPCYLWGLQFLLVICSAIVLRYAPAPKPQPSIAGEEEKAQEKKGVLAALRRKCAVHKKAGASAPKAVAVKAVNGEEKHSHVAFTPITLVCKNLKYYVTDPSGGKAPGVVPKGDADKEVAGMLQLLHGIDFTAAPGDLTALMGGSGAGT